MRALLRAAALLCASGVLTSLIAGSAHPAREPANNHAAVFLEYAESDAWIAVHLGQFIGMALLIAGLLSVLAAVRGFNRGGIWAATAGAVSLVAALALYAVLQAVDGVALKHSVDSWAAAPDAEKASRFAAAETIRWIEWAVRSYQSFVFGTGLICCGIALLQSRLAARFVGATMALSGIAYVAQGWIVGSEGFSPRNAIPNLAGIVLVLAWSAGLAYSAWRVSDGPQALRPHEAIN